MMKNRKEIQENHCSGLERIKIQSRNRQACVLFQKQKHKILRENVVSLFEESLLKL